MKQYLDQQQTAKLIELGLPKPRYATIFWQDNKEVTEINYSIGELIEMLPPRYNHEDLEINRDWRFERWLVFYRGDDATAATELIDALYEMIVILKEEGVI
jgi:hypothetical protein